MLELDEKTAKLTCPASISSMNFRAAAPLRVNTAVPLPKGFLGTSRPVL